MRPVIINIPIPGGVIPLHSYGVMIVVGFLIGTYVADREARRRNLPTFMYELGVVMLLTGIIGGRLFYYIQFYQSTFASQSFFEVFKIWKGGLVFYGGAILALPIGVVYCVRKKLPIPDCLDMAAIGVPLAMAMGRIGCFLNGCCFGKACEGGFPLGVIFPMDSNVKNFQVARGLISPQELPISVHPVQLYQAAHDFLMFALLFSYLRFPGAPRGAGMPLLFVLYGIGRFVIEGFRGDHDLTRTGLTPSQNISLGLLIVFGGGLIWLVVKTPWGVANR